jgi:hypothetical protein
MASWIAQTTSRVALSAAQAHIKSDQASGAAQGSIASIASMRSPQGWFVPGDGPGSPQSSFPAFYGIHDCNDIKNESWVSFVDAAEYPRLVEVLRPIRDAVPRTERPQRAEVRLEALKKIPFNTLTNLGAKREGGVAQTLLYVAAMEAVALRSPAAHQLVWEDDCQVCRGAMHAFGDLVAHQLRGAEQLQFTAKVGNGGSGILVPHNTLELVLRFLKTRRSESNVDILFWRATKEREARIPDFVSKYVYAAHRGERSSFMEHSWLAGAKFIQRRIPCSSGLEAYWGKTFYVAHSCDDFRYPEGTGPWKCGGTFERKSQA